MNYSFTAVDGNVPTQREVLMYRNPSKGINWAAILKEIVKKITLGFLAIMFVLGWSLAESNPTCSWDYQTGVNTCTN